MILEFSWPHKMLSPNARPHPNAKMIKTREARAAAYYLTRANHWGELQGAKRLKVTFTFHPPDRRKRDLQNAYGATKALCDGVADAILVDDSKWCPVILKWGEVRKPGLIVVELEKDEEE